MKPVFYCCLLVALITVSCRDNTRRANNTKLKTDSIKNAFANPDTSKSVGDTTITSLNRKMTTEQLLSMVGGLKKEVEEKLSTASKTEADEIYDAYLKANKILVGKIIVSEIRLLDKFYEEDDQIQLRVKKLGALLKKYDLDYDEIGEGIVEIKTKNDFYNNIFRNYVSDDYKEYIAVRSEENKVSYVADAALLISFERIGERIIVWEKLLSKYPRSKLRNKIRDQYQSYQSDYLFGLDNTSTIEFQGSEKAFINTENIDEFNRFMAKYPSSPTNRLIKIFLKNFKDEKIRNLIDSEQQKL
ncbi:hypothetical protein EV200_104311 [Pedobacter psychrotolerans]|uniref:Uncharacterized protein n=1 Tax=Pedobacter psychrotolerans TaxID=1843235 RepID=A0A4R2HD61_9SPHI|nr:hypothetical protein [Pedobacter psychrotolerans]TCO25274.1 hypothetical protein EV200_104311 [Pedobacter psychrotolerans]